MQRAAGEFPSHDPTEARLYAEPYVCDPRNQTAEVVACEQKVTLLQLPPHDLDPTGAPDLHPRHARPDPPRERPAQLVCDLKTGKTSGWAMLHDYAYQQAAYVLAARASGWPDAEPGYIIRCYGYRERSAKLPSPDGVQWWLPFDVRVASSSWTASGCTWPSCAAARSTSARGRTAPSARRRGSIACVPTANKKLFSLPMC
jgi:hypothetical protein